MRELASIFKALSDETRLEILSLLLIGGELCVCDVEAVLGITQSKSSRHLRYLLGAGLVENRREGAWMHYWPTRKPDSTRKAILNTARRLLSDRRSKELQKRLESWLVQKNKEC